MTKSSTFCSVLLLLFYHGAQAKEINLEVAFDMLSNRIDNLAMDALELKENIEKNIEIMNSQISDIAGEFNDMSERMNVIFSGFAENANGNTESNGDVMKYISSRVKKELAAEKRVLRKFVERYENELENLGRYVSDMVSTNNTAEMPNMIPTESGSANTCDMCMLVATTTEKKTRRLEKKLDALTNETMEREEEYLELQSDVGDTMEKVLEIEKAEHYQTNSLENITNDVDALKDFVDSLSEKNERKVGFTARLTKSSYSFPGNKLIVFDEVKYNYGEGYDELTGIFKAPKSGTYLFSFNVQSTERFDAHVCLIVNGTLRLTAVAGTGHRITGGNTGIVYMEMGEEAWIRTTTLKPRFGIWPHRTTFSGVLLD